MKHLNFILAGLFFLCGLCCRAQVLPLEENVVLNTKEGQIKGKMLLPGGVKTCPVVLIIAGSGPTDMDGNSAIGNLRNNSLKFLAEGLAANGIASLRFDKRGIGTSASAGKEESKLRFEDYVNDVTGWIDYLAKEKRFTTITVAGHSEGALIGMLACQNRPKVKGYISVAGAGRPAYEIIEAQVAAQQNPEAVRKEVASINGSLKNGKEVIESINHFLDTQTYPREKYDIAVAATQLSEEDLVTLLQMPVNIVVPDKEHCTKIYAIQQVMERYSPHEYDAITIFNSDNKVVPNALELFNNAYYSGCDAIQAHRMTENLNTNIAVLNATSEEINNHLFRKAHTALGFSSALIGSGMMFDFEMFQEIAPRLSGSDLAKATEMELLKENIYTEYMEEIVCYCKKTDDTSGYSKERQRWLGSQYRSSILALQQFPIAFLQGKWDLCEKLFQWLLPSRFLLILYITICAVAMTFLEWPLATKWYALLAVLFITFLMAMPEGEISRKFRSAFWSLPILVVTSSMSHITRIFKRKKKRKAAK